MKWFHFERRKSYVSSQPRPCVRARWTVKIISVPIFQSVNYVLKTCDCNGYGGLGIVPIIKT